MAKGQRLTLEAAVGAGAAARHARLRLRRRPAGGLPRRARRPRAISRTSCSTPACCCSPTRCCRTPACASSAASSGRSSAWRARPARVTLPAARLQRARASRRAGRPRVVLAVTTPPDADGFLSFGVHAGASYRPFLAAARDPERLAIAEVNRHMPRVAGLPELGGNRIHVSEVDAWVEHDAELVTLPDAPPSAEDLAIARHVCERIPPGAILQFGIGAIPNAIAGILAARAGRRLRHPHRDDLGRRHAAAPGRQGHQSEAALRRRHGRDLRARQPRALRLARRQSGRAHPAGDRGERAGRAAPACRGSPASTARSRSTSRDRSPPTRSAAGSTPGTGGHESFVSGAGDAPEGRSFLCLRSTATVDGRRRLDDHRRVHARHARHDAAPPRAVGGDRARRRRSLGARRRGAAAGADRDRASGVSRRSSARRSADALVHRRRCKINGCRPSLEVCDDDTWSRLRRSNGGRWERSWPVPLIPRGWCAARASSC